MNQALIDRRKAQGISRRTLARHAGVSEGTIRNIEFGRMPRLRDARAIAAALECKVADLWPDEEMEEAS